MLAVPLVEDRIARKLQQIALCGIVEKGKATNAAATLRGAAAARLDLLAGAVPLEEVIVARNLPQRRRPNKIPPRYVIGQSQQLMQKLWCTWM
jgi:hypothetical protein